MFKKILSILTLALALNAATAHAGYNPVPRNLCALAVQPFNANAQAITGQAGNQYLNILNNVCSNFLTYSNAYAPNPPNKQDNPLAANAEGKNVPITKHIHAYFNDSVQDNYYYGAFVDRFEITLKSDAKNSIDINNITCGTPVPEGYNENNLAPINDCSGTVGDLWGGTTVSKQTIGNDIVVTWDFASTPNNNGKFTKRPKIFGNNGNNFEGVNFTDENNRKLQFYVNLPSKDNDQIWSATTSSRALIAHLGIKKTNYPQNNTAGCANNDINNQNSGWCYLPPPNQYPTETVLTTSDKTFHWFPIGSVATVWREPAPEKAPNICEEMTLYEPQKLTDAQVKEYTGQDNYGPVYRLLLKTIKFSDITPPADTQLTWKTLDSNGTFLDTGLFGGLAEVGDADEISRPLIGQLGKNQIWYKGNGPVNARISGIPEEQITKACNDTVQIPQDECKEILIDHNEKIYVDTVSTFKAKSLTTSGSNFKGKITYSVNPGYGEFYLKKPKGIPTNPSKMLYEATPPPATTPFPNITVLPNADIIIDPNILIGNSIDETIDNTYNTVFGLVNGDFGIGSLTDYINFDPEELNQWENLHLIEPTIDPPLSFNPSRFAMTDVFDAAINPGISPAISPEDLSSLPDVFNPASLLETITVDANTPVYFVAKKAGKNVVHVRTQGTDITNCNRDFDIEPKPPQICSDLGFESQPASPLEIGKTGSISINPKDANGKPLPPQTKLTLSTTAGGKFTTATGLEAIIELKGSAQAGQFPIQFENSDKKGEVIVSIDKKDPNYSPLCTGKVEVVEVEESLECKDLQINLSEVGKEPQLNKLQEKKMYFVQGVATYSEIHQNTVTYEMDPKYGAFLTTNPSSIDNITLILKSAQSAQFIINKADLDFILSYFKLKPSESKLVKQPNEGVTLITFSHIPGNADPLHISATGFHNNACDKYVPIIKSAKQCQYARITPIHGYFDPAEDFTVFNIEGNLKDHPGEFEVSVTGKGTVSKFGEENYNPTIVFTQKEIQASNNTLNFSYKTAPGFDPKTDIVKINLKATGDPTLTHNYCDDELTTGKSKDTAQCLSLQISNPDSPWIVKEDDDSEIFQIKVTTDPHGQQDQLKYTWKVTGNGEWQNGKSEITKAGKLTQKLKNFDKDTSVQVYNDSETSICYDYINAKEKDKKEKPTIEKVVYPTNNLKNLDSFANISSKTPYLTYMLGFHPGDAEEVELSDSKLKNGEIQGNLGGNLSFRDISINIIRGNKSINIYKSPNYQNDNYDSSKYSDEKFSSNNKDYECGENDDDFCHEEDIDEAIDDFKQGNGIKFKNLNKLGANGAIIIKYQMTNNTKINEEKCKQLTAALGCGEEFNNTAEFEATMNDITYKDKDKAKTIVICPFVLTRSGGDVFFHDVIDTGIDVAQCSQVKGHTGPGITPTPAPKAGITKTGGGNLPENLKLFLDAPTHDVCRFSNQQGNVEGYNDVLKHFSSTICELRADVSEKWQEKNINASIAANITRIGRFAQKINNLNDRNSIANKESGVFLREGNLTIDELTIQKENNGIPAAQTYIVKNGNLIIRGNIEYGPTDYTKSKEIPSAAFIVINGNIEIKGTVDHIDGILMAVDLNGNGTTGKVLSSNGESSTLLTINGNLIGNVYDLFKSRIGVGDPAKDQGSVTVRYDERILLNTPPGISQLIDVRQAIVPN